MRHDYTQHEERDAGDEVKLAVHPLQFLVVASPQLSIVLMLVFVNLRQSIHYCCF